MNANYLRLVGAVRKAGGVVDGFREWSKHHLGQIADSAHTNRSSIYFCLSGQRRTPAVRRAIELAYELPTFSLDRLIDGKETNQ